MPPIFVMRHGETTWNVARRIQGSGDAPLTLRGEAQVRALQPVIRHILRDHPDLRVRVSPQGRARHSWDLAIEGWDAAPDATVDPRLAEVDMGAFRGLTHADIAARWPDLYAAHPQTFDLSLAAPGGERFDDLIARIAALLADVTQPTLFITHGITSVALRGAALGLDRAAMGSLPFDQGVIYAIDAGAERVLTAK